MSFEHVIQQMPEDVYLKLKKAVELGKWEDGTRLTLAQQEHSLQAVIAYQALHDLAERLPLDANGNVSLKVTPCASSSSSNSIDIKIKH